MAREKDMSTHPSKIHPLVAVAAGSVIVVSLVGTAAIMDWLPGSRGDTDEKSPPVAAVQSPAAAPAAAPEAATAKPQPPAKAAAPKPSQQPPVRQSKPAQAPAQAGTSQQAAQPMPPVAATAPACEACGKVIAVRTVEVEGKPSGVGTVAGVVVGGLLGNQVGGGTGKTLATVAGAVGGGYAGNEIEKRTRKSVAYEVDVRMENGSQGTFKYDTQPSWQAGDRVKVVDGTLAAR